MKFNVNFTNVCPPIQSGSLKYAQCSGPWSCYRASYSSVIFHDLSRSQEISVPMTLKSMGAYDHTQKPCGSLVAVDSQHEGQLYQDQDYFGRTISNYPDRKFSRLFPTWQRRR